MTVRLEKSVKRFLADHEGERLPRVGDQIVNEVGTAYTLVSGDLPPGSTVKFADTGRVVTWTGYDWSGPAAEVVDLSPLLVQSVAVQTETRDLLFQILARMSP